MSFNAGRRYNSVCIELGKKGVTREEIAEKLGIRYNSTVKYYPMERFSPSILRRLELLKDWGINPLYFQDEKAEMFLATEKETDENQMGQLINEIKRSVNLQERLIERIDEQTRIIAKQNTLIEHLRNNNGNPKA